MKVLATIYLALFTAFAGLQPVAASPPVTAVLHKNPGCQCCDAYAAYLRQHGFDVTVTANPDLESFKREHGVLPALAGCHTMLVDHYVVEGHVPADVIAKLLRERPNITGISLPGMPPGSPGMTGEKQAPFVIYTIEDGEPQVYATR